MLFRFLTQPKTIIGILILQLIPLMLFPPSSFSLDTQEWWLPVLLALMAIAGVFQIVIRRSTAMWPWYLVSFAQGFNIISRLMMIMPHATFNDNGVQMMNWAYIILTVAAMLFSSFLLWFSELPEVRLSMVRNPS